MNDRRGIPIPSTYVGRDALGDFKMDVWGVSHVGNARKLNEDAFLIQERPQLWAVADGMGGHAAGDWASCKVIESLSRVRSWDDPRGLLMDILHRLEEANAELRSEAESREAGMIGSTVVCLVAAGDKGLVIWAGDSRAYRLRAGSLERLSKDHSYVQELVDAGAISPESAERHSQGHVLTRAVGGDEKLRPDFAETRINRRDVYLLCSDGLTRCLSDQRIAEIMGEAQNPEGACNALLEAALDTPAKDNITIVIARAR